MIITRIARRIIKTIVVIKAAGEIPSFLHSGGLRKDLSILRRGEKLFLIHWLISTERVERFLCVKVFTPE